jgi:hypothetical protein
MTEYDRFFKMLDTYPRIAGLWDRENRSLDIEHFEKELKLMSSGERHLAKFFAGIWFGDNRYGFDPIEAVHALSDRGVISNWIENPFFP